MKTRGSTATASVPPATPVHHSSKSKARDKQIRDKTNNPLPPPAPIKHDVFKKSKKPKPKSKKKSHRQKGSSSAGAAGGGGGGAAAAGEQVDSASLARHAQEATSYLHRWENNRSEWRFEKLKQIWLLKHALNQSLINDEYFEVLLNYLTLLQGAAKSQTLKDMRDHMTAYENKYLALVQKAGTGDPTEEDNSQYERARQIVQILSEDEEEVI